MTNASTPDRSVKNDKKKKSIIPKIFGSKGRNEREPDDDLFGGSEVVLDLERRISSRRAAFIEGSPSLRKSFSERHSISSIESLTLSNFELPMPPVTEIQDFRIFVATWNVGGKTPNSDLNLEDFLQVEGSSDIYVFGFQEIVPLNAGNVLVIEDNEPAAKWLAIISQALNKPYSDSRHGSRLANNSNLKESKPQGGGLPFFQKPSLKVLSKNFRVNGNFMKNCNCPIESLQPERRRPRELDELIHRVEAGSRHRNNSQMNYRLITSKQMVGIFLSVWVRNDLVQHIGHLRVSSIGRGIMGRFGNKGCISVSMSLHQTTFCFVCSHLASGEKEGDELRRNSDVAEIIKNTQFPKICKNSSRRIPEKILDHDRVFWFGDLNYRVSLSYEEAIVLLEDNDWNALLEKDQLIIEREAGTVFTGWNEGRIFFAPTYKYSINSDCYAGETIKSKKKRRTPAWCDRILWYGNGIEQLSYIRGESRLSDHRSVCAVFVAEVEMRNNNTNSRTGITAASTILDSNEFIPQRHSFYEF